MSSACRLQCVTNNPYSHSYRARPARCHQRSLIIIIYYDLLGCMGGYKQQIATWQQSLARYIYTPVTLYSAICPCLSVCLSQYVHYPAMPSVRDVYLSLNCIYCWSAVVCLYSSSDEMDRRHATVTHNFTSHWQLLLFGLHQLVVTVGLTCRPTAGLADRLVHCHREFNIIQ